MFSTVAAAPRPIATRDPVAFIVPTNRTKELAETRTRAAAMKPSGERGGDGGASPSRWFGPRRSLDRRAIAAVSYLDAVVESPKPFKAFASKIPIVLPNYSFFPRVPFALTSSAPPHPHHDYAILIIHSILLSVTASKSATLNYSRDPEP